MYRAYHLILLVVLSLFLLSTANSQDIIYQEDFENGLPAGWESIELNGTTARWRYCADHSNPYLSACPKIWTTDPHFQLPFQSTTANNGFMNFDSDAFINNFPNKIHNAYMKTPALDFSKNVQVWLKFDYHIGVFNNGTKDRALVEVSTDNTNWSIYNFVDIVPGNTPEEGLITWSKNASIAVIDISNAAAESDQVYVRWRWESTDEYFFAVDDIQFYNADPNSLFFVDQDLEMANFFAVYPNFLTPKSQVESFGFLGDFYNRGWQPVENAIFKGELSFDNNIIFQDSLIIKTVPPFSLIENQLFNLSYGDFSEEGTYYGEYSISGVEDDPTSFNNAKSFQFRISDSLFAKAGNIDGHLAPTPAAFGGFSHIWEFGNYYFLPNGEGQFAKGLSFSIAPLDDDYTMMDYAGVELEVKLSTWTDENGDGLAQGGEYNLLGVKPYVMNGFESQNIYIYVEFPQEIALQDNTAYLATVKFKPNDKIPDIRMGVGRHIKYGGMIAQTRAVENPRYASVLLLEVGNNNTYTTEGFGFDLISTVRLHLKKDLVNVKTSSIPKPLHIYPNPNNGEFWLQRSDFNNLKSNFRVYDVLGNLVYSGKFGTCNVCKITLPTLPTGSYILQTSNANEQTINKIQLLPKGH